MPVKLCKGMYFHNGYTVKGLIRNMFQVQLLIVFIESVTCCQLPGEIILIFFNPFKNTLHNYYNYLHVWYVTLPDEMTSQNYCLC